MLILLESRQPSRPRWFAYVETKKKVRLAAAFHGEEVNINRDWVDRTIDAFIEEEKYVIMATEEIMDFPSPAERAALKKVHNGADMLAAITEQWDELFKEKPAEDSC